MPTFQKNSMNIAVFLPNWLGDLAMATPALRAMRRHFGQEARIVGILRPYLMDILGGTDWLDDLWPFDPGAKDRSIHGWTLASRMRREDFDTAVLFTNSLRTAIIAWCGGAKRRIGYARYCRGPLLTEKLHPRRAGGRILPEPMVESYLAIVRALGCGEESPRLELHTTEADERAADTVFGKLNLLGDRRIVLLNSSGAFGGAKLWPVEYFGELARRIVRAADYDVLVMCGPKERGIARQIVEIAAADRVCSMAEQPMDLGTAKACMRRGRLMVSTDSGPRHIAAALGLPIVALYGPMLPIWSENPTQQAVNLVLDLPCIGCHERVCPLGHHRCMRDLTVDRVFEETMRLLKKTENQVSRAA
jgi:heptosyltransferase II